MAFPLPAFETGEFPAAGFVLPAFIIGEDNRAGAALPSFLIGEYSSDLGESRGVLGSDVTVTMDRIGIALSTGFIISVPLAQWNLSAEGISLVTGTGEVIGVRETAAVAESSGNLSSIATSPTIFYDTVNSTIEITGTTEAFRAIEGIINSGITISSSGSASAIYHLSAESIGQILSGIEFVADYFDGWAYNLNTGAGTQYEQFKFNSFGKLGDKYYGLNEAGIYELTGADDAGSDIDAVVTLGKTDFDDSTLKTIPVVYAGARSEREMLMSVDVDQFPQYEYTFIGTTGELAPVRVKLGRGLKGLYWTFEFRNKDGAYMEIDMLDIPAIPTSRKV